MNKHSKILIVAAHPDDEVLGCGATIARHKEEGDTVWVVILGEGITSRKHLSSAKKKSEMRKLYASAKSANIILGADRLILKKFPDNTFDSVPLLTIIHAIEMIADEFKPDIIYTHHITDVNIDHRRTAEAVEAVVRPSARSRIKEVYSFEVPSSTEWNFMKASVFRPNVFINIESFLDKKLKAMSQYRSEIRSFPHPRSLEYLKALAQVRGGQAGMLAAEAFELVYLRRHI